MSAVELTPSTLPGYVEQVAPKYGLDPAAVLAVASQEGLGGGIGDQGTSFGPWQLHAGGALPPQEYGGPNSPQTQGWAWSTAGVDYALAQIAASASGLSGLPAIEAIVTGFERPANPSKEISGAASHYGSFSGGGAGVSAQDLSLNLLPGVGSGGLFSIGSGVASSTETLAKNELSGVLEYIVRGALLIGGLALAMLALVLFARAFGSQLNVPAVSKVADTVTPAGRAVRAASRESRIATAGAGAARERRAEEAHQARVKTEAARTTEIRSRSRRKATEARRSREAEFNRGYIERATEEASPNLSRARQG